MSGFNPDDYEPVAARIDRFWHDHPDGRIITDLVVAEGGVYRMRTAVYLPHSSEPVSVGWAQEDEDKMPMNMKTSVLEVCETSAIGRALANLGYQTKREGAGGTELVRPSREEMMAAARDTAAEKRAKLAATPPRVQP